MPNHKKFAETAHKRALTNQFFLGDTRSTRQKEKMNFEKVSKISIKDDDISGPNVEEYTRNRLFVSNFPFCWKEIDLKEFFAEFGPVDEVEIVYNDRGSKGFGFVTINNPENCLKARTKLNQKIVQGRCVEVRFANKNKRATNTGPPMHGKAGERLAADTVAQFKRLNAMLVAQAAQLQQNVALQAFTQPAMMAFLQNQLTANALANNYQMGLSSSCATLPALYGSNGSRTPLGFAGPQSSMTQPMLNDQTLMPSTYQSFAGFDAITPSPTTSTDTFSNGLWHYDAQEATRTDSRHYSLFGASNTDDFGGSMDRAKPLCSSSQHVDLDDEGNIEIRPLHVWSTPVRPLSVLDRSFSTPNVSKMGF